MPSKRATRTSSLDNRPLPPPPAQSDSMKIELLEAKKQAELRKLSGSGDSPGYLNRMVSHLDRLIQPASPLNHAIERRALSAPMEPRRIISSRPLPSIHEANGEDISPTKAHEKSVRQGRKHINNHRIASAPEPRQRTVVTPNRFGKGNSSIRNTIRVVDPSSPFSPVKMPAPLTIRKKSSNAGLGSESSPTPIMSGGFNPGYGNPGARRRPSGLGLHQQYLAGSRTDVIHDLGRIDEGYTDDVFADGINTGTIVKRKGTWFRRSSKSGEVDLSMPVPANTVSGQATGTTSTLSYLDAELPLPPKKKGFSLGRLFKKRSTKPDMSVCGTSEYPPVLHRASYLTFLQQVMNLMIMLVCKTRLLTAHAMLIADTLRMHLLVKLSLNRTGWLNFSMSNPSRNSSALLCQSVERARRSQLS